MTKNTLLIAIIVALCILNLAMLFSFFVLAPASGKSKKKLPRKIIIERLHFDEQQIQTYKTLIDEYKPKSKEVGDSIKVLKKSLYSLLSEQDDSEKEALLQKINGLKSEIERIHYHHFKDIKELCNENQLDDFKLLANDLAKIFRLQPPPPPKKK